MANKGQVLVVGPHDIPRMGMERILEGDGYEVLSASCGKAGGGLIASNHKSLLLIVLELGLTKGVDTRPILKAARRYGIPFVYATYPDLVLDQDVKREEVLRFVGERVRQIGEK